MLLMAQEPFGWNTVHTVFCQSTQFKTAVKRALASQSPRRKFADCPRYPRSMSVALSGLIDRLQCEAENLS